MKDVVFTSDELRRCGEILEAIARDSVLLAHLERDERNQFLEAAGRVAHPGRKEARRRSKFLRQAIRHEKREIDRATRATVSIRTARLDSVFVPPPRAVDVEGSEDEFKELVEPRDCYICKQEFTKLHFFYDAMCPSCARFNYEKRFQTARLDGRVALITGSRLKIGYQAALMMLRAGATVIATTRFPKDSALRYSREPDFNEWKDRLHVYGLDLRHSPSVEIFCKYLVRKFERLDILINNAAQTVRRPPGFYAHLIETESRSALELPAEVAELLKGHEECKALLGHAADPTGARADTQWLSEWHGKNEGLGITDSAALSQIPYRCEPDQAPDEALFPQGRLDADLQQVDLRGINSWRLTLADVPTAEMLEVQLVNSVAPFILCAKLKPLMLRHPTGDKHIVNVSAMEGKFARRTKTDKHPHTNMAKAALNMLTLTSARDYVRDGIHMNAVDTGWVTDEDPAALSARKQQDHDFQPPLDIVDGAARVCDPFFAGLLTGKHSWGCFLKDYVPTEW